MRRTAFGDGASETLREKKKKLIKKILYYKRLLIVLEKCF